jgi:hypothetical protein
MVGRAVSLDLAKALWKSLMVGRSCWSMQHGNREGELRFKWLAMCSLAFKTYLKLDVPRRDPGGGDVGVGDFVGICRYFVAVDGGVV